MLKGWDKTKLNFSLWKQSSKTAFFKLDLRGCSLANRGLVHCRNRGHMSQKSLTQVPLKQHLKLDFSWKTEPLFSNGKCKIPLKFRDWIRNVEPAFHMWIK